VIAPLYRTLLAEEQRHETKTSQIGASSEILKAVLAQKGMPYDELMFSL
jgi:hypothetical protein